MKLFSCVGCVTGSLRFDPWRISCTHERNAQYLVKITLWDSCMKSSLCLPQWNTRVPKCICMLCMHVLKICWSISQRFWCARYKVRFGPTDSSATTLHRASHLVTAAVSCSLCAGDYQPSTKDCETGTRRWDMYTKLCLQLFILDLQSKVVYSGAKWSVRLSVAFSRFNCWNY